MKELLDRLLSSLSPSQICWLCLLVTAGLALFSIRTFADNGKVDALNLRVTEMQSELLESRIFETRLRQCTAETGEARAFYGEKVAELTTRYRNVTGNPYRLPACDEVR